MAGQSKVETLPPWGNAVAGAAGAVIANTLVYPLDLYVANSPSLFGQNAKILTQPQDQDATTGPG